ncbi:hypothetical protein Tco_0286278 [Tanacetum coccineum]
MAIHPAIGMSLGIVLECSDWDRMCIRRGQQQASLPESVICHPVEVRAGCCLEADASDSRGFFKLCSSSFVGG